MPETGERARLVEMDTDALKVAAEFVLTTPSEYEASPKKKP